MKRITSILFFLLIVNSVIIDAQTVLKDYPVRPVPFTSVKLNDKFWAPRVKLNHEVTIPIALKHCYSTGRVDNFLFAANIKEGQFCTEYPFDDTDIYKIIEGASYSLQTIPDKKLDGQLDTLIEFIGKAQEPDGYLYTNRTIDPEHTHAWAGKERWEMESDLSHELYNSGHLFEAAVAHFLATGKRSFLDIAIKNADLLVLTFGPGKLLRSPGHQVVEMGLVKMYRVTGKKEYLDLAKFFIDSRGQNSPHARGEYSQDHLPVTQQTKAVGHAVRATYLYSGMADVAAITGDSAYLGALDKIWNDIVTSKLYITGGIGAAGGHEGFGPDYDLPNMSAYNETCASIGSIYWNYRMFLLHGNSKYFDVLEQTLYNGMVDGVSLTGDHFFYPNPLESMGQHSRSEWFGCACCPSNVCRFIPSVPGYIYGQTDDRLFVNLYIQNSVSLEMKGKKLDIEQVTNYPWDGDVSVRINLDAGESFEVALRIPCWANNEVLPGNLYSFADGKMPVFTIKINGKNVAYKIENGYAVISKKWKKGDEIQLNLPMETRRVKADERIKDDAGKVAMMRGPMVYCVEWPDFETKRVLNLVLPNESELQTTFKPDFLGGVSIVEAKGKNLKKAEDGKIMETPQNITAIPYFTWANRGSGEMAVWLATENKYAKPLPPPTVASESVISASIKKSSIIAINDGLLPENSNDHSIIYYHWWPEKNSTQWIQYNFPKPAEISSTKVYWFDDGPFGGCRIPESWKVLYQTNSGDWKEVETEGSYPIVKDEINTVRFKKVNTFAVKIEIQLPEDNSAGIYEWIVE
ncbi:MAG TPA: glycoside hydrolase family 127 protein [Draconibacterium sp.]|nr:glycoside hydrolase family 127 protein [Draconibacterium sp.]